MKRSLAVVVVAVVLVAFGWYLRNRSAETGLEDGMAATEVPVHVGEIIRTTLRGYVTAYGTVEPEPDGARAAAGAKVQAAVPGVVAAVRTAEGQAVEKGKVLFELDSRVADVAVEFARKELERETNLIESGGTSEKRLQAAEQQLDNALAQRALLRITSPLAGTVTRVNVKAGEAVDLTTVLAEIVDADRLVVGAGVPVAEAAPLEPGQPAEVFADNGGAATEGELTYVSSQVDTATGTVPVRIALPAGSGLRSGQFVGARIVYSQHTDCLAVPVASIAEDDEGGAVIAVVRDNVAVLQPVETGLRDNGLVEIIADDLQPGMTVVTEGAYALPQETPVVVLGD